MAGKFTNQLQAAVLFDRKVETTMPKLAVFVASAFSAKGLEMQVGQAHDEFAVILGAGDLHITLELVKRPAERSVFDIALGSGFVRQIAPEAAERVQRHRAMVLIEVRHGVLPDMPEIVGLTEQLGLPTPGRSFGEFQQRNDVLAQICRFAVVVEGASLVHWTPSNMLILPESFPDEGSMACPNVLSIHPILFGGERVPGYEELTAGFYTIGAAHLIGREIHVVAAPVPWVEQFESALAFVRLAIMENGYIIPDDDTWGPESQEFSYRVRHFDAGTPGVDFQQSHYRLTLERDDRHGWTAPDFVPTAPLKGGLATQVASMDANDPAQRALLDEWAAAQNLAQGAGGDFVLSRRMDGGGTDAGHAGKSPVPTPTPPDPAATASYEADRPLDPNDPMDRAIMKRLREREAAAEGAPSVPTATVTAAPAAVVNRAKASFGRRKGGFDTRH